MRLSFSFIEMLECDPRPKGKAVRSLEEAVVVAESVAAAGGAYPVAYATFLAKKLLVSAVHFVIASVFALSRSVAWIAGLASLSGVTFAGLTAEIGWIT